MAKKVSYYKYLFLVSCILISFATGLNASSQHDMSNMPGMSKPKPKSKAKAKLRRASSRKRTLVRKRTQPPKKHDMSNMPGMQRPTSSPSPMPSARHTASPHTHKPEMQMPGMQIPTSSPSPNPPASPEKMDMNMPMPSASPTASPHTHTPGMKMPATTPAVPTESPAKMDMNTPMPSQSPNAKPAEDKMPGMDMSKNGAMDMGPLLVMSGSDLGIRVGSSGTNVTSMGAMGSGTSWQPSSAPMYMIHKQSGSWLLMFHYNAVIGVNSQGGPRGVTKFESANWFMPMAYHKLGKGTVQLRGMFSFEPFTFPPGGSPLLFQTGETYKGQPLIDRQHPHDLFMELSAQYTLPMGEHGTWFTYFGYPGEPALGPVAFMHRASAAENPAATLSHHLQDSSHISFGVLTTGITYRWLKLEGSIFNGREPDENRYNFEAHKWNSRSARLSLMPNSNWTMQVSYGFLRRPEASEPDTDIRRATASVQYNKPFDRGNWASAFIWGRNHTSSPGETHNLNGYTFESTVNFLDKNYVYTRLELVDKNELLRALDRAQLGISDDHPSFRIGAFTFGGARDVLVNTKLSLAMGSDVTFYSKPDVLDQLYGEHPVSWKLFLRLRPGKMDMNPMHTGH